MYRYTCTYIKINKYTSNNQFYIYTHKKCKRESFTAYIQSVNINLYHKRQLPLHLLALKVNFILAFDEDLATTDDGWNISKELSGCDLVCVRVEFFLKDDHKMIYKGKCSSFYEAYLIYFSISILNHSFFKNGYING